MKTIEEMSLVELAALIKEAEDKFNKTINTIV